MGFDFDAFLYATVGENAEGLPLSVVSVLARADLDPWKAAARYVALPEETAVHDLAALIGALSLHRPALPDNVALARSLIALLPHAASPE